MPQPKPQPQPQCRPVTLNYDPAGQSAFGPDPHQVPVNPGDTIQFSIGASTLAAHPHSKLRITLHDSRHFLQAKVEHGPNQPATEPLLLGVKPGLPADLAATAAHNNHIITGYKCELLDGAGNPIPGLSSDGSDGGEIVPETGAS